MKKRIKLKTYLGFIVFIILFVITITVYYSFFATSNFEGERIVIVSKGMNYNQVADSLKSAGVIRSKFFFILAGKFLNLEKNIRIGKYLFVRGMSNLDILKDLKEGKSALLITVTIREGIKAVEQAKIFARELGIDSSSFVNLVFDKDFANKLGVPTSSLEGYLMPNTFHYFWQTDEEEIVTRLVEGFWKVYNDTLQSWAKSLGLSMNDVITMASIVEGETDVPAERPIIAGVYYNRLRRKMLLQADPTIQYVLQDGPRRLRYSDLKIDSPYNTYKYLGLPPGPVNNPGREAIIAALYPAHHPYLYFVATGNGGHTFSKSYFDHQRAVKDFRKKFASP